MYWTKKHVVVCTASHCAQKGANELIGKLRLEIIRRKLDSDILINNCGTIDLCDIGPNLVIYPDNVILSGVTAKDVKQLVAFLQGDGNMDDFLLNATTSQEANRRGVYDDALKRPTPLENSGFLQIAESWGFDSEWVDEQARRGFIARKTDPEQGVAIVSVTSKAKTRYKLSG
jgi:(2Fe-2S) ferredoxin